VRRKKLRGEIKKRKKKLVGEKPGEEERKREEARGKREKERKENQFFINLFHQSLSPLEYKSHLDSQLNPRTTPIY
jgi:hypothetical protein